MPHKCVTCSKVYPNSSPELLKGCACGSRIFLYMRNDDIPLAEALDSGLSAALESGQIERLSKTQPVSVELVSPQDAEAQKMGEYLGAQMPGHSSKEQPAENITVIDRGEYELDIASLMAGDPLVVRSQNGIYYLKIPTAKKSG